MRPGCREPGPEEEALRRQRPLVPVVVVLALGGALVLPISAAADDQVGTAAYDRNGQVRNVLPPGSRGNVSIPELAELGVSNLPDALGDPAALATASPSNPKNFADQLQMY